MDKKGLLRIFDLLCNLYGTAHLLIFRGYGFFFPGNHTEIHHSDGVSVYASVRVFQQRGISSGRAFPDSRIRAHEAFRNARSGRTAVGIRPDDAPRTATDDRLRTRMAVGCRRNLFSVPVVLAAARIERGAVHRVRTRILPRRSRDAVRTERGEVAVVAEFFPVVHGVSPCAVQFRNVLGESAVVAGLGLFVIRAAGAEAPFRVGRRDGIVGGRGLYFALPSGIRVVRIRALAAGVRPALATARRPGFGRSRDAGRRRAGRLLAVRDLDLLAGQLREGKYPEFPHR